MSKVSICVMVLALSAVVLSAPAPQQPQQQEDPSQIQLVRYVNNLNVPDGYQYTYELSNGNIHSEAGALKEVTGEDNEVKKVIVVSGSYSFVGPDGQTYWVNYTADENGYHPTIGTGPGGIKPGDDAGIDPNALKSLLG